MFLRTTLGLLCISVAVGIRVQAEPTLYAIDGRDDVLFTTSTTDASASLIGSTNENNIINITFLGERLLGYEGQNGLYEIDVDTGAATQIGGVPSGYNGGGALAYDSSSDELYAMLSVSSGLGSNHLVTLDPNTGQLLNHIGVVPFDGDGMAIDPVNGDLYLLDIAGTNPNETLLWRVDKNDATAVNLGITGLDRPQGMAFHPATNELYIAEGGFIHPAPQGLYTLDPSDLSTQFIGDLDYLGVSGMAFTPEPSMLLLFGISGFVMINQRKRRR